MSRLADIYKSEKKKGGSLLSTLGKRTLEKIDPRQLFDQSGLLAAIAPAMFKKYSATTEKQTKGSVINALTQPSVSDAKMDLLIAQNSAIITNSQISAKNSLVLPVLARDINVMRQNIVKMVKLQGGTPATKADMFFKTSKEREAEYEAKFGQAKQTKVIQVKPEEKKGGGLGFLAAALAPLLAIGSTIVGAITGALAGLGATLLGGIMSALSVANLMKAFGVVTEALSGILKIATMVAMNPLFLALAGITSVAALLAYLRSDFDKDKSRYMDLALKKKEQGSLSVEEQKELEKLERPVFRQEVRKNFQYDPKTGQYLSEEESKKELSKVTTETNRQQQKSRNEAFEQLVNEGNKNPTLKDVEERVKKNSIKPSTGSTPEGMKNYKPRMSPSQVSGVDILNRAMDKEGITDEATRDRIVKLAMTESGLIPDIKGPVIPSGMHKGDQAHGLLQIMPKTAEGLGFSREQIQDPEIAAVAGVRYFKQNLQSFNNNLDAATVAHHAGPGGARKWLQTGSSGTTDVATGLKTDDYLKKVTGMDSTSLASARPSVSEPTVTLASSPARPSSMISDSTVALADTRASIQSQPIVVNAPTTNNVQQGGNQGNPQYTAPAIVDSEFMKLLVSRAT